MTKLETDKLKKLKAARETLAARIKQEEQKLNKVERAKDTRRKVLVGAAMLFKAENDQAFHKTMMHELGQFLTRGNDRALFGLPALPDGDDAAGAPKPHGGA